MIRIRIEGPNFDAINTLIDRMAHPDLMPLAQTLAGIMVRDNRDGLLAGTDSFGDPMAPVKESTIRRGRGGDGEPLNPRGAGSRAIADYRVDIEPTARGAELVGHWPGTPFIHFHATGTRDMISRDPVGIRPDGQEQIRVALHDFAASLIGGQP